jgi:hypothetical protein
MVAPSEVVSPHRPGLDSAVADHLLERNRSGITYANPSHLNCFIDIKSEPGSVAEEEHNDDGEQEGSHGGVPAVAFGDAVVDQGGPTANRYVNKLEIDASKSNLISRLVQN